jgi:hypothetical protein
LEALGRYLPRAGVILDPAEANVEPLLVRPDCFLVLMDEEPRTNGRVSGWWCLSQDLRPE